jgi:hypothetical protein
MMTTSKYASLARLVAYIVFAFIAGWQDQTVLAIFLAAMALIEVFSK